MTDDERRVAGNAMRRRILGDAHVNRATEQSSSLTREFQDLITRYAWGEIWTRAQLDERTRRVLVLGTLIALGHWDEFRMHARAALSEGGFMHDLLREIVLQQAIYCGVPAANRAMAILQSLLDPEAPTT